VDECWKQVELKGIAEQVNAEQLEMLYDYVRAR